MSKNTHRLREKCDSLTFKLHAGPPPLAPVLATVSLVTGQLIPLHNIFEARQLYAVEDNKHDAYIKAFTSLQSLLGRASLEQTFVIRDYKKSSLMYLGEYSTLNLENREENFCKFLVTSTNQVVWFNKTAIAILLSDIQDYEKKVNDQKIKT